MTLAPRCLGTTSLVLWQHSQQEDEEGGSIVVAAEAAQVPCREDEKKGWFCGNVAEPGALRTPSLGGFPKSFLSI